MIESNIVEQLIIAGERAGQAVAVEKQLFPISIESKDIWEKLGFVFTGEKYNDVLQYAVFPDGWGSEKTDHNMWNNILDAQGRIRGTYFYKASFYDLRAFIYAPWCRYVPQWDWNEFYAYGYVLDQSVSPKQVIFRTDDVSLVEVSTSNDYEQNEATMKELKSQAKDWLVDNFPNYENPLMYW